jgi:2-polyprenyl-3-methyl-5-hydroxy-6-metoxy-1,4-benzoquinol methylase
VSVHDAQVTADTIAIASSGRSSAADSGPLQALRVPRPVDRYDYVREQCRGLRVLDLGAYDETEVERDQSGSWRWLHAEIASVAAEVLGVDSSPALADTGGIDTSVGTRIVHGSVDDIGRFVAEFKPDLVVAGELIEHTPNTIGWLSEIGRVSPGTRLLATTPNTTSVINMALALLKRENAHPDHIQVYSFRTLATLAGRVPMSDVSIRPYYYDPHLFIGKVSGAAGPAVGLVNRVLRLVQWLFPLTAFGLVLEGTVGSPDDDAADRRTRQG